MISQLINPTASSPAGFTPPHPSPSSPVICLLTLPAPHTEPLNIPKQGGVLLVFVPLYMSSQQTTSFKTQCLLEQQPSDALPCPPLWAAGPSYPTRAQRRPAAGPANPGIPPDAGPRGHAAGLSASTQTAPDTWKEPSDCNVPVPGTGEGQAGTPVEERARGRCVSPDSGGQWHSCSSLAGVRPLTQDLPGLHFAVFI